MENHRYNNNHSDIHKIGCEQEYIAAAPLILIMPPFFKNEFPSLYVWLRLHCDLLRAYHPMIPIDLM